MKNKPIPVIDLFAGPGGLGEGFSALPDNNGNRVFRIALSIEKDEYAHQTLELRSFFRQFEKNEVPEEYYQHLRGELSRNDLFEKYPDQSQKAKAEAFKMELGNPKFEKEIDEKIDEALKHATNWVLIGGPPCQAYSLVGRSRKQQGKGLNKEDEKVYLYRAYYRILAKFNPPIFIMENVKGILSSRVMGEKDLLFKQILTDLKNPVDAYKNLNGNGAEEYKCPGYKIYSLVKEPKSNNLFTDDPEFEPGDFVIKCENFGVPQTRHRVILLGIRNDIKILPYILKTQDIVTVEEVINDLPKLRSGLSKGDDNKKIWKSVLKNLLTEKKLIEIDGELRRDLKNTIKKIRSPQKDRGREFVKGNPSVEYERNWYIDDKLKGFCNHSTRGHIVDDLYRYFFASCFAKRNKVSPKLIDFPPELLPDHNNIVEALKKNKFADRFRIQLKDEPAKTITSHISKDGHYYIHYDPTQCRSLTVREAARIQTFPDNYYFCGPRTSQYVQVGNAVPPLLAYQIAAIISDVVS